MAASPSSSSFKTTPFSRLSFEEQLVVQAGLMQGCIARPTFPLPEACPGSLRAFSALASWHAFTLLVLVLAAAVILKLTLQKEH